MASLGDFFSNDRKNAFAEEAITVGAVVKIWLTSTTPPKEKRIIIVGTTATGDYLGVVLINSEINWNVHRNHDIIDFQYFLRSEDCEFLAHDSYADCLNLHSISRSIVLEEVSDDLQKALGRISDDLLAEILNRVKTSPTITPKQLKRFGLM